MILQWMDTSPARGGSGVGVRIGSDREASAVEGAALGVGGEE
jgi:hypothetical protein